MANRATSWSYKAGEKGRNRVRAYEHQGGLLMLEWYETSALGKESKKRQSLGHRDRDKAKRQADKAAAALGSAERQQSPSDLTLKTLFEMYLGEVTPEKSPKVQLHDRLAAYLFLRCFGQNRKPQSLNRRDWDRFRQDRSSGRLRPPGAPELRVGPRTVAKDLKWLLAVLAWAERSADGRGAPLLDRNPLRGLPIPREEGPRRPVMSDERFDRMLAVAHQVDWRFRLALILADGTGHRLTAMSRLRWSDIDLEGRFIDWDRDADKIGKAHRTPMADGVREALLAVGPSTAERHGWVLPSPEDPTKPCRSDLLGKWFLRGEELAGLEHVEWLGWHAIRRRFASAYQHLSLRQLCDLGGWKDPNTVVKCYQHTEMRELEEALLTRGRRGLGK